MLRTPNPLVCFQPLTAKHCTGPQVSEMASEFCDSARAASRPWTLEQLLEADLGATTQTHTAATTAVLDRVAGYARSHEPRLRSPVHVPSRVVICAGRSLSVCCCCKACL